jgi:osmoprotectant transport system ATP-binding protein
MATQSVEFAKVSLTPAGGREILHEISLRVEPGTTTALLGRSGSGKTTLLRTVNALVTPTGGRVLVGESDVAAAEVLPLRRSIGYVIQETGLFPHMTVSRNAALPLLLSGEQSAEAIAHRVEQMLSMVGLSYSELGARYPWQLSGGQRQRVGVARALVSDPKVLLMDEPFGALDPLTRAEMQTMLRDLLRGVGVTTLIVTHDLDEALYLADHVVLLEDGRVVADLTASEVRASEIDAVQKYVAATCRSDAA